MKKLILNTLLILFTVFPSIAQDRGQDKGQDKADKIKSLFTAFLTEKLEMTVEESRVFWATHNELEKSLKAIRKEKKELRNNPDNNIPLSDKDLERNVVRMSELLIMEIELNRVFILECFEILDPTRASKITALQKQFRARIKERRNQSNNSNSTPRRVKQ